MSCFCLVCFRDVPYSNVACISGLSMLLSVFSNLYFMLVIQRHGSQSESGGGGGFLRRPESGEQAL